jgi:tRNA (cmo5U34)-methyltransferase
MSVCVTIDRKHVMQKEEITAIFDRHAAGYDQQWSRLAPLYGALHALTDAVLAEIPPTAQVLCVGAGTGAEIFHFADKFPGWRFTAVEPSRPMLDVFQQKAEERGILFRCSLHCGYLDSLPSGDSFDTATAFLVSQFILEKDSRTAFFQNIANRLRPGGILVSSDLAGDLDSVECESLLELWVKLMRGGEITHDGVQKMREAYRRDVAVLPPREIGDMIARGGFESPVLFFQSAMIHGWYAKRKGSVV